MCYVNVEEKKKRILPPVTLSESYRLCAERIEPRWASFRWIVGNLPHQSVLGLQSLLALIERTRQLCDVRIERSIREQQLEDLREDFRNNFMEEESTDQFPALLDTMKRHSIPQQYLHDIVAAADMCIRIDRFQDFDQWLQLGCRLGGGAILAAVPILGYQRDGFESAAIRCGQAIFLTSLLAGICRDPVNLNYFMPVEEMRKQEITAEPLESGKSSAASIKLVESLLNQIEPLHRTGGELVSFLEADSTRVMKSVIALSWSQFCLMKKNPGAVISGRFRLRKSELVRLRLKHLVGMEGCEITSGHAAGHNGRQG